ncbi:hypothetical protein LTR66_015884, partial [Elasticomyces elasticus]
MESLTLEQPGLRWDDELFAPHGVAPGWEIEPEIDAIRNEVAKIFSTSARHMKVVFLAQGAFNRVYRVEDNQDHVYAMRVSLPVYPQHKTLAEVATLVYLEAKTTIPTPRVLTYSANCSNEIGFEYILMTFMPGMSLQPLWQHMRYENKLVIVKQLAAYNAELFKHKFNLIGSLRLDKETMKYSMSQMAELDFFYYRRIHDPISKGPFDTAYEMLESHLQHVLAEMKRCSVEVDDDDDSSMTSEDKKPDLEAELGERTSRSYGKGSDVQTQTHSDGNKTREGDEESERNEVAEDAGEDIQIDHIKRILQHLTEVIYDLEEEAPIDKRTVLTHTDLNANNILVDPETLKITAVIDWEMVSALPVGLATQIPCLLKYGDKARHLEPVREEYSNLEGDEIDDPENALHEGKNMLYWIHLEEHHNTILERAYKQEMRRICPKWMEAYKHGEGIRDIYELVQKTDSWFDTRRVAAWLQ